MEEKNDEILQELSELEEKNATTVRSEDIMTFQEVHEYGVELLCTQAENEGFEILQVNTNIKLQPQLVLERDNKVYFVIANTVPYTQDKDVYNRELVDKFIDYAEKFDTIPMYAGIGLRCLGTGSVLLKKGKYLVHYTGMIKLKK